MKKNKTKTPSILANFAEVPTINSLAVEGVDYINVHKNSKTELGKMLAPGHPINVKTVFGKIGTLKGYMEFISLPGYPTQLLAKSVLTNHDFHKIPKVKKVNVPNYWSIIAVAMVDRVKSSKALQKMLLELDDKVKLTSFNLLTTNDCLGMTIQTSIPNSKMGRYLAIIRCIRTLLKEDKFNNPEEIKQFILATMDNPSVGLYTNTAYAAEVISPAA